MPKMKMPKTSNLARGFPLALALAAALAARSAEGQTAPTVTISGIVTHSDAASRPSMPLNYINRADCLGNDQIGFPLTLSNFANTTLEVWAGTGACDMTTRTNASSTTY